MACDLCRNFPERALRQLNDDLEKGELSVADIAEKHYVSVPLLEDHKKLCVTPLPTAGHELLESLLREITRVSEDLKQKYEYDPDVYQNAMSHYLSAIREAREIVLAMERIRPSEEMAVAIIDRILTPLISLTVRIHAEEADRLREDLVPLLGGSNYRTIDKVIKRSCVRFASRLQGDASSLTDRLNSVLTDTTKASKKSEKLPPDSETVH
jgi:hypothetical protein